ncbi:MAG TPA: sigma 54-interacting transcriptional regulator, partial [Verrucomicrobiae bacterium]|nr:sigma 54-interacting transcriptional regulator [Verrucomicrobiae bacterium]
LDPLAMVGHDAHVLVLLDGLAAHEVPILVEFCNHKNEENLVYYSKHGGMEAWLPPFQFGVYRESAREQFRFAVADLTLFHERLRGIGNFGGGTLLLTGPTGCGKSAFARFVHNLTCGGKDLPFHEFNMAQLPQDAVNFRDHFEGHEKGAFTGALTRTGGAFRECKGGTLFLDELEGLNVQNQIALLNYMQELEDLGRVRVGRLGNPTRPDEVSIRMILATNMSIEGALASGKLREDFLYRTRQVCLPGLKEIYSDCGCPHAPVLYLLLLTQKNWRSLDSHDPGRNVSSFALRYHPKLVLPYSSFYKEMKDFEWRGNLRQLSRFAQSILPSGMDKLCGESLDEQWNNWKAVQYRASRGISTIEPVSMPRDNSVASLEPEIAEKYRELLVLSLERASRDQTKAARLLRMDIRTFQKKIKAFGVESLLR